MSKNETSFFEVPTCVYLGYINAVDEVLKYCEAKLRTGVSKGRDRRIGESEHKTLCMSICEVWDDMEGMFATRRILGTMVPAKLKTDWAKRVIAREMSTILETLQTQVIGVVRECDRRDLEATLGWTSELLTLDGVFARASVPHPMCNWIDAQVSRLYKLQETVSNMVYSARPMPRGRDSKVTPMDFVFAVALHNSAVDLAA